MTVVYILLGIMLVMVCYLIFTIGRIYECSVEIRECEEKIDKLRRETESIDKQIAKLKGGEER